MNAKHTPGPWRLGAKGRTQDIKAMANMLIARVEPIAPSLSFPRRQNESDANAQLIAAAPDMFRELAALIRWLGAEGLIDRADEYGEARAAIAQATGQD
jgi:hypothetical protein